MEWLHGEPIHKPPDSGRVPVGGSGEAGMLTRKWLQIKFQYPGPRRPHTKDQGQAPFGFHPDHLAGAEDQAQPAVLGEWC